MSHVLAKIKGAKVTDVKRALHADAWHHAQNGLEVEHVWQNDDDPNEVQFLFEANDLAEAKKFVAETHEAALKQNPNATLPTMTFLAGEDDPEFDFELPEGEDEKEDDKGKSDTRPQTQQGTFSIKNISLTVGGLTVGLGLGYTASLSTPNACPAPVAEVPAAVTTIVQPRADTVVAPRPTSATVVPTKTKSSPAPAGSADTPASGSAPTETPTPNSDVRPSPVEETPPASDGSASL
ncbi:hypothetical protein HY413_02825 [Candidatus Kaiserbacteria bacterium]|nr:hypothetical protein [Candidatus Kaiserbacteria bacterium]